MSKSKGKDFIYVDRHLARFIACFICDPFEPLGYQFLKKGDEIVATFLSVFKDNERAIPLSEFAERLKHIKMSKEAWDAVFVKVGNLEIVLDNGEIIKTSER